MYTVYRHVCPNGKMYIGMTSKDPKKRWESKYGKNKRFNDDIQKYGWNNIKHEVLFSGLTQEEAEEKEIELIKLFDSTNPARGYNIAKGGKSNSGYHHSEQTKNKIKKSLQGKKHTAERIKKQSISQKKLWESEGYKEKMRMAHLGKSRGKNNPSSKEVCQYSLNDELIKIFESTGEAERITGISHQQISNCCNGKQKTCHGYIWKYKTA